MDGNIFERVTLRFTPTCVGTILACTLILNASTGSPPRVWGRSVESPHYEATYLVHPHVCGDDGRADRILQGPDRFTPTCVGTMKRTPAPSNLSDGSPPRVWGRFYGCFPPGRPTRFTPTCVGTIG